MSNQLAIDDRTYGPNMIAVVWLRTPFESEDRQPPAREGLADMPQMTLECPHCRAERIGFKPVAVVAFGPGRSGSRLFLQCEGCGEAIVAAHNADPDTIRYWIAGHSMLPGIITDIYPKPAAVKAPADIPTNVSKAFLSALDNLGRPGNSNAAAIMFRRSIELAVKAVNASASKRDSLEKRINDLSPDVATPAMKDWAHHVRLDANEAAHEEDEEFSEEDAQKLHLFAEMFLTYAFTLPKMLKRARGEPDIENIP